MLFGYFGDRIQAYSYIEFGSCIWSLLETGAYREAENHKMDGFLSEEKKFRLGNDFSGRRPYPRARLYKLFFGASKWLRTVTPFYSPDQKIGNAGEQ